MADEIKKNDGRHSEAVEDSSVEEQPKGEVLSPGEAREKIEDAPEPADS